MFEIDKKAFGEFLAAQRKAKGYTQKELAEKLFVSDKAVSKWERALSLPDVSLLIPLADILNVSVTELLEGRLLPPAPQMDSAQVEAIVKKAVSFSDETPEKKKNGKKEMQPFFLAALFLPHWNCSSCSCIQMKPSSVCPPPAFRRWKESAFCSAFTSGFL